jgi:uncharacterized NAD-dependent epimerase/dehydratase family protein
LYFITSLQEIQDLNPFIIIGCGGGGEKFANFEGVEACGFIDDDPEKQGMKFCKSFISQDLKEVIKKTNAKSVAIMLPIGAEGTALKYAVEAIDEGKNVITSFRSLPISQNEAIMKFAKTKGVILKEISPRLDVIREIFGTAPPMCTEILPKLDYKPKTPVVFIGGTSQECGKRTTTRLLGKAAKEKGLNAVVISTDEMGFEQPVDINFRAGSLSVMDVASAVIGSIKYMVDKKNPDIIFIEGQSSLTERGNPHPRGLSAAILIGAMPMATVVCHRPNHPYREPRGIDFEIKAIEALEPTNVVGLSINLRNVSDKTEIKNYEEEYNLPAVDVKDGGASRLMDIIIDHIGDFKK